MHANKFVSLWGILAIALLSPWPAARVPINSVAAADETPSEVGSSRSPVDLVLTPDGDCILTVNQSSGSVSLLRAGDGKVLSEVACGRRPTAIALSRDGTHAVVSGTFRGELTWLAVEGESLRVLGVIPVGAEPRGVAISSDGKLAYAALTAANEVAVVDLATARVETRIAVGRWPRYLSLSPDGSRLAVGCSGDGGVSVVDTQTRTQLYDSRFMGLNLGQMQISDDGQYVYFPYMVYADRPITQANIREGWVLGNRLARVRLDGKARREAMALDPRGHGVADPHGVALSPDGQWIALTASGTHELILLRKEGLPLSPDGTGDHLKSDVIGASDRFVRIPLEGRPMAVRFDRAGQRAYVVDALGDSVLVVDIASRKVARKYLLGPPKEPTLARLGEAIFYDALRSTDGWYSCHSCHYEGDTNSVTMDTKNDGSFGTFKTVLPLQNVRHTGPWFWHGLQDDLQTALKRSLVDTMQGPQPTDDEVRALAAFLDTLDRPPNAVVGREGKLSTQAERGKLVFESEAAACASCHRGPYFTDGLTHNVGLASQHDAHEGFNTPSLLSVGNRTFWLHHGKAKSLADLLRDLHGPQKVSGNRAFTEVEIQDLVEYLRSL